MFLFKISTEKFDSIKDELEESFDDIGEYGINVLFGNGCECVFFKDNILILLTVGKSQSLISCVDDYISLEWS